MIKQADCFLKGTEKHPICQDYVRINKDADCKVISVVLSDGCSGSLDTDIGSRLLNVSASDILGYFREPKCSSFLVMLKAKVLSYLGITGFDKNSMFDATLLWAYTATDEVTKTENVYVFARGDGVIIYGNGSFVYVYSIDYSCNAPEYFTYDYFDNRRASYDALRDLEGNPNIATVTLSVFVVGTGDRVRHETFSLDREQQIGEAPILTFGPDSNVDFVVLSSDGIKQIGDAEGIYDVESKEPSHLYNFVMQLISIKNKNGVFLQRRLSRFFSDNVIARFKKGEKPVTLGDDISFAFMFLKD